MTEETTNFHPADTNGDGKVSSAEEAMYLEFKRKELEDADAMRDAQRNMTWFALGGLLLYPFAVVLASLDRRQGEVLKICFRFCILLYGR